MNEEGTLLASELVTIPNTEVLTLKSSIVEQEYRLHIAFPDDYRAADAIYPLLLVTDANSFFGLVTETVRLLQAFFHVPPILIAGIGYPVEGLNATHPFRSRDLTPTERPALLERYAQAGGFTASASGGAGGFLAFIEKELIPFLQANYRVKAGDVAIGGHSFGGLFALYALLSAPHLFQRYLISSASYWWDAESLFDYEADLAALRTDLPARVFMSAGSLEEAMAPPFLDGPAAFVSNLQAMADRLCGRGYESLDLKTCIFDDETHVSVYPGALSRGLRVVFS
jgi:predicted alpha/beta superfamily hydrolase